MGHLHAGHLSLIEIAKTHATRVIVSIFVNPIQFNQVSDFERYPRTLEDDLKKLKSLNIDIAFTPSQNDLYPNGTSQPAKIIIPDLTEVLEGHYRPGHFEGVCTVVCKLFNIINPDIAVFGRKDYQQLLIIRRMVEDLNFNIKILAGDTQREDDGLAMSSRNSHLNHDQRQLAAHIFNVLTQTKDHFSTNVAALEQTAVSSLTQMGFNVEYFAIRDANNLQDISQHTENIVVLVAAWLGDIRLIDNLLFPMP
jgi:pantoate--beta-alanine ligase